MKFLIFTYSFVFLLFTACLNTEAQQLIPVNQNYGADFKKNIYVKTYSLKSKDLIVRCHTSDKPYYKGGLCVSDSNNLQILFNEKSDTATKKYSWAKRKIFYENFIHVVHEDFILNLNPLLNLNLNHTIGSKPDNYFRNTRGLLLNGNIGHQLYFETSFYENQAGFVPYLNDYIKKNSIIPGNFTPKIFKITSFDYGTAYGRVSYSIDKVNYGINFQVGNGKNFFGDGYRSMLFSDFSAPYPFLKITANYKRWRYVSMTTSFINFDPKNQNSDWNAGFQKKTGTFHYLSYFAGKSWDISLFEGTLWQVEDSGGYRYHADFFNPLILFHTAEFGLNGKNNTILGLNLMYKASNKIHLYGQFAIDDIRPDKLSQKGYFHNRYGMQVGAEGFDMFGIENLNLQAEYNQAKPYTYSYKSAAQNYSNYNQPLAHPLGANFREAVGILRYHYKKVFLNIQLNMATYGADTATLNWGKNIFLSDEYASKTDVNKITQGIKTNLIYADVCVSYLLNKHTNLNIFAGASYRKESSSINALSDKFVYFGIRTSLLNEYVDF